MDRIRSDGTPPVSPLRQTAVEGMPRLEISPPPSRMGAVDGSPNLSSLARREGALARRPDSPGNTRPLTRPRVETEERLLALQEFLGETPAHIAPAPSNPIPEPNQNPLEALLFGEQNTGLLGCVEEGGSVSDEITPMPLQAHSSARFNLTQGQSASPHASPTATSGLSMPHGDDDVRSLPPLVLSTASGSPQLLSPPDLDNSDDKLPLSPHGSDLDDFSPTPKLAWGRGSGAAALAPLPDTPTLCDQRQADIDTKKGSNKRDTKAAFMRVQNSIAHTLQTDPLVRERLEDQAISLSTHTVDGGTRPRTLTPLVQEAVQRVANKYLAGLGVAEISTFDRALFMVMIIYDQLRTVPVADAQDQHQGRMLAEHTHSITKKKARNEGGQMTHLAVDSAIALCGLGSSEAVDLHKLCETNNTLNFQRTLRDLAAKQGPQALALVHKAFKPGWVRAESSDKDSGGQEKQRNSVPSSARTALIKALTQIDKARFKEIIAAAHDPAALKAVCENIQETLAQDAMFIRDDDRSTLSSLRHALARLQGWKPDTLSYSNFPPEEAGKALDWLRQLQSARQGGTEQT
jgi:hypothetical protein